MIRKLNGIDYSELPNAAYAFDSVPSDSTADTVLSTLSFPNLLSQSRTFRIRAVFRKGTTNLTTYNVKLFWNTGQTLNSTAVLLARTSIDGNSPAVSIERNFSFQTEFPGPINYSETIAVSGDTGSDIGVSTLLFEETLYNYALNGFYIATANRTSIGRTFDTILCSYLYIEIN